MTIDELKTIQNAHGLRDIHIVELLADEFVIAHTDSERSSGESLEECELHKWLTGLDRSPADPGIYVTVPHEPDAYSEPYMADPWDLIRLEDCV